MRVAKKILIENKDEIINRAGSPDRIVGENYIPGNHHFFKGGLLCHLLGVTKLSIKISELYKDIIDMDLIIFTSSLHDIGKIKTYERWNENNILKNPSNNHANMVQHTYLGMEIVSKYLNEEKNIDVEYKEKILHIIASHMTMNAGALVPPSIVEAVIVSEADHIECMLSQFYYNK